MFHLLCADLNKTYGRALAAEVGLYWFCAECRGILVGQKGGTLLADLFKRVDTIEKAICRGDSGEDLINGETAEVSALELLPVEIWVKVFQNLSGYQLRQIRQTCRSWNQIVGSSTSLMNKLMVRLPKGIILDQDSEEAELLLSCKNRYLHVVLDQIRIVRVNRWWLSVAENLESLSITKSPITIASLLAMLKPSHNLKSLTLSCGPFVDARNCPTKLNFKLPALETLVLEEVDQSDLLDVFAHVCPRLKVLKLPTGSCAETHPQKVAKLVAAVKGTLQEVELPILQRLWLMLGSIDELHFKGMSFSACNEQLAMKQSHLMNLVQKFPTVEMLNLSSTIISLDAVRIVNYASWLKHYSYLSFQTFEAIGKHLTNLKRLQISPRGSSAPLSTTFLHQMLDLTHLDITGCNRYYSSNELSFTNCRNNSLKFISLKNLQISKPYSGAFPYITHLNLSDCKVDSWSVIFDPTLPSLRHITLDSVSVEKFEDYLADYMENLQYLSIRKCELRKSLLVALVSLCPKLTEISLSNVGDVDDEVVQTVFKKLNNLRKIAIKDCYKTTKLSMKHFERHRSEVEFSHFSNCNIRNQSVEYTSRPYETYSDYSD